jgi:hypothetical protein
MTGAATTIVPAFFRKVRRLSLGDVPRVSLDVVLAM